MSEMWMIVTGIMTGLLLVIYIKMWFLESKLEKLIDVIKEQHEERTE